MTAFNKNNPFKTPEGYFENFSDALEDELRLEKLNVSKEAGFAVPESYFENLTQELLLKIEPKETKVVSLYKRYYVAAASIAAATIIALITLGIYQNQKQNLTVNTDIALEVIEDYILEDEGVFFDFNLTNELVVTEDLQFDLESIATQEIETFLETELDNINFEDYEND